MKTKIFMLLAAVLLSASAFAQSGNTGTLKGDVNGDGVVDVADINAIIQIMKDGSGTGEETKYYWYNGTTEPTASNLASIKTGSTSAKPTTWVGDNLQSVSVTNYTGASSYIYYCFPTSWNVTIYDSDKVSEMLLADVSTFTLNGVEYTVKRTGRLISNGTTKSYYAGCGEEQVQNQYYWYVGQTQPTSMTSVTAQDSGIFTNNNWHTINVNNTYSFKNPIYNSESNPIAGNSNTYWYVALPADKSYGVYDSVDRNEVTNGNWTKESNIITVNNVSYNVYKSVGTYRKFNVWWIH